ncbi:MAG: tRNA glutamyl-Q(34) synthetase GluQRS [Pontibacterium sp.]
MTSATSSQNANYVGRFAPSPTGQLHLGSLVTALASFLDARAHQGQWLLRIEDLDPPREVPGASDSFFTALEHFGLHWDSTPIRQSEHIERYHAAVSQLAQNQQAYPCTCSRKQLQQRAGSSAYDGFCHQQLSYSPLLKQFNQALIHGDTQALQGQAAVRAEFVDGVEACAMCERIQQDAPEPLAGDFVILRKDGLTAYQLAVVVDDAYQGITHVVRGCDLIVETPRQKALQRMLGYTSPSYAHVPAICYRNGQKLSKQTFAPSLTTHDRPEPLLLQALQLLNQQPDSALTDASQQEILHWAISHWDIDKVPKQPTICLPELAQALSEQHPAAQTTKG